MSDCTCGFGGFHDDANTRCALYVAPSPYRFTVSVEDVSGFDYEKWEVRLKRSAMNGTRAANYYLGFCATEAEARSHAALVLAALHQATLEGDAP